MSGFNYTTSKPKFLHYCDNCKFMFTVHVFGNTHTIEKSADIYESCDKSNCIYIVRFSDDPADYMTTNLTTVMGYYVVGHFDDLRKSFFNSLK